MEPWSKLLNNWAKRNMCSCSCECHILVQCFTISAHWHKQPPNLADCFICVHNNGSLNRTQGFLAYYCLSGQWCNGRLQTRYCKPTFIFDNFILISAMKWFAKTNFHNQAFTRKNKTKMVCDNTFLQSSLFKKKKQNNFR